MHLWIVYGHILGALAFPAAYVCIGIARRWDMLGSQLPLLVFAMVMAGLIVYKHRSNIARLRAGKELRIGQSTENPPVQP